MKGRVVAYSLLLIFLFSSVMFTFLSINVVAACELKSGLWYILKFVNPGDTNPTCVEQTQYNDFYPNFGECIMGYGGTPLYGNSLCTTLVEAKWQSTPAGAETSICQKKSGWLCEKDNEQGNYDPNIDGGQCLNPSSCINGAPTVIISCSGDRATTQRICSRAVCNANSDCDGEVQGGSVCDSNCNPIASSFNYQILITPNPSSISKGTSKSFRVEFRKIGDALDENIGSITCSTSLPFEVTCSPSSTSSRTGQTISIVVNAPSITTASSVTVTVTGKSTTNNLFKSGTLSLTLVPFNYYVTTENFGGSIKIGTSNKKMTRALAILTDGSAQPVTFSLDATTVPPGVTYSFTPTSCTPDFNIFEGGYKCGVDMYLSASALTTPNTYLLKVTGKSGTLTRQSPYYLTVSNDPVVIKITLSSSGGSLTAGGSAIITDMTVERISGLNPETLSFRCVDNLSPSATCLFLQLGSVDGIAQPSYCLDSTPTLTNNGDKCVFRVQLQAPSSAQLGIHDMKIYEKGETQEEFVPYDLTVNPGGGGGGDGGSDRYSSSLSLNPLNYYVYRGDLAKGIATVRQGSNEERACSVFIDTWERGGVGNFNPAPGEAYCDRWRRVEDCRPPGFTMGLSIPPGESGTDAGRCDISTTDPDCSRQLDIQTYSDPDDAPYGAYTERFVRTKCYVGDGDEDLEDFTVEIVPYTYDISVAPDSAEVFPGESVAGTVNVINGKGQTPKIPFACLNIPAVSGIKCSFSSAIDSIASDTFSDGTSNGWQRSNSDTYIVPTSGYLSMKARNVFSTGDLYGMEKQIYVPPLEGRKLMLSFNYMVHSEDAGGLDASISYGSVTVNLPVADIGGGGYREPRDTGWVTFSGDISSVASQTSATLITLRFSTYDSNDEHTYAGLDNVGLRLDPPGGGCTPSGSPLKSCSSGMTISTSPTTPEGTYTINVAALSALYETAKYEPVAVKVKNLCGNDVCNYPVEDQLNCKVDCNTTVAVDPKSLPAGQPISVTVYFNDSRYKIGNDVKLDVEIENKATTVKIPWNSGNGCSVGWIRKSVSEWNAISEDGYFKATFTCTVPSLIGAGDKKVWVTPKIYP